MSTLKVDYIKNRVGTGAVELSEGATIPTGKNLTIGGNATVTGNFTVNGTTTTISTTNTVITDKLIELSNGASGSASGDAGIIVERGSDVNTGVIWDESADRWTFATGSFTGASTGDLSLTTVGITAGNSTFGDLNTGTISASSITGSSDLTIGTDDLFVDVSSEMTILGSTTVTGGDGSSSSPVKCRLAVIGAGAGFNTNPWLTMLLGSDGGSGAINKSLTNDTTKEMRMGVVHYKNDERPMNLMYATVGANDSQVMWGSGTSSMNAPTIYKWSVANDTTTPDCSNLALKIEGRNNIPSNTGSRLELYGGFSEELDGNWSTQLAAEPTFDCSQKTMYHYSLSGNITKINLTGVDTANKRATTVQILISIGGAAARTIANVCTVNGGSNQDLRWPGHSSGTTTYTSPSAGIVILTLLITSDTSGGQRVFGFTSDGH